MAPAAGSWRRARGASLRSGLDEREIQWGMLAACYIASFNILARSEPRSRFA